VGLDRQASWASANIDEAGGFFTDPDFGRGNSEQYEKYVRDCARECKCSIAKVRSVFKRVRHNKARTSYRIAEMMTPEEADELAGKVLQCVTQEATFYEGTTEYVRFVYLKHPLRDKSNEKASHLLNDPVVQKAIEACKSAMLHMSSRNRKRGDSMRLNHLVPRQIFVNVYPPGGNHSAPWHRDVDTVLGSAIVVLRGDGEDYVQLNGGARGVCNEAPPPGSAIVMSKNCEHAVPKRKARKHTRVALVIWI